MKLALSVKGGGIRGAVPARALSWVEAQLGPCAKAFDIIGGVSTGGILTCGLCHPQGFSAAQLLDLYVKDGAQIFHRGWADPIAPLRVKFEAIGIETVLKKHYGTARLSETTTECLITAHNIVTRRGQFYKRWKARADPKEDLPLWVVSRATSAAPTYFPPAYFPPDPNAYIDGGVFGTDPSLWIWSEAHHLWPGEEIVMLSLGTGYRTDAIDAAQSQQWGEIQWLTHLSSLFTDGTADAIQHVMAEDILDADHYFRIDAPILPGGPDTAMDNATAENIQKLIALADKMIADNQDGLQRFVKLAKSR